MNIGLIDVDGHRFPNLALMRLSAYHKARGDAVEWWWSDLMHYDVVYMSKIFSDAYTKDAPSPINADKVIKGGTGYAIQTVNGSEVFRKDLHIDLPAEVERCFPDYSIYPQYDFAVSMTSRGCPRGCRFCHVGEKEGQRSIKVADVGDFWSGQKKIKVLDPNITACKEKRDLFKQYLDTGAEIDFTQGLDIRLINDDDIEDINRMRVRNIHFAWDKPEENLEAMFKNYAARTKHKPHGRVGTVYILTNFGSTTEEDLHRIYTLDALGYDPYVMIYNKPSAPLEVRRLQAWCNNKRLFRSCRKFSDVRFKENKLAIIRT